MKKLRLYSNDDLFQETKSLVEKERQATLALIECLAEVEVRMLYATLGYPSLWQFCTQCLGLSEGAAQRRISAMRLSRQIPEVKEAISEGKVSLSNASKLERFFSIERKQGRDSSLQQKAETVSEMHGLS